jgi:hypothetical protein
VRDKFGAAVGVPFADDMKSQASTSSIPQVAVGNKPAPGLKGPKGVAPRTNYSRVNTGPPPETEGSALQKNIPPDAMSMLPQKVASEVTLMGQATTHMTIQDMIKAAAAGAASRVSVTQEATRQLTNQGEEVAQEKTAAADSLDVIPTPYVDKLASAIEYIVEEEVKEATVPEPGSATKQGPGDGPQALQVMQAESSDKPPQGGSDMGQATAPHVPPKNPPQQQDPTRSNDPGTGLMTNDSMQHPEQPADPMGNDHSVKTSAAGFIRAMRKEGRKKESSVANFLRLVKKAEEEMAEEEEKKAPPPPPIKEEEKKEESKEKESAGSKCAGVDSRLVDYFMSLKKQAEDAINPAQVSGTPGGPGEQPPPGASASGEQVPSEPADVNKQKSMIDSNQAAIDYTKGQAKADPKSDVDKVLTEPALSAAHDSALQKNLDHTGEAGVKISHAVKSAATRALLEKLAAEAKDEKSKGKEKDSQGMAGGQMFTAPGVRSGTGPSPAP